MKIEKVNDHQIRCTLTREDLADRELKLSELAYGTEKAKDLFRDMMQQAAFEFGFEAEDIPLMIEAIPLNSDCIVLIITKVEDPEELDTRFSKFAPSVHEDDGRDIVEDVLDSIDDGADDVLDLFKKIQNRKNLMKDSGNTPAGAELSSKPEENGASPKSPLQKKQAVREAPLRICSFKTLDTIISLSHVLTEHYHGVNSLYKAKDNSYILVIFRSEHSPAEFNKVCNILSEYGSPAKSLSASEAYLQEHCEVIIKNSALQSLASI